VRLHEFFRDDPVWRLDLAGRAAIDVSWSDERPEEYAVSVLWWENDQLRREQIGTFTRDRPLDEVEALLEQGVARVGRA
jgi:hypothetical protein